MNLWRISFEGREIEFWYGWVEGSFMDEYFRNLAADYEATTGVTVNIVNMQRDLGSAFRPALLEGTLPDIIDQHIIEQFPVLIKEGHALELSDFFKEKAWDQERTLEEIIFPGQLDIWPLEEGSRYYIPWSVMTSGFFYNKTDFEARGFSVPDNWDDLISIFDTLSADGIAPISHDGGVDFYNAYYYYWFAARAAGSGVLNAAAIDKTAESWDNPDLLEAAKWVYKVGKGGDNYFIDNFDAYAWPGGQVDWSTGKAATILIGNWVMSETKDKIAPDWKYGFMPFPTVPGGKGELTDIEAHPYGFVIPKDSENTDVAKDFSKFVLSAKWQKELLNIPYIPVIKGLEGEVPDGTAYTEAMKDIIASLSTATEVHEMYDKLQGYAEWFTKVFLPLDDQLLFGKISPEEFIENIKAEQVSFYSE